ncbi:MAG: 4'-phosphopantetheinyl transferase superfamily protein [Candidatus Ancillula sp.]|jgi:4'-phosphopantetheinyl transferase|nr:4'-phosphopantetheinyl transferase superfamily protein [Candidatus Ancillula sp.]
MSYDCNTIVDYYAKLPQFLKQKVDMHKFEGDKHRSILAYSLLVKMLGHKTLDKFIYNQYGKPFLLNGPQFSISHSKNHVAVALSNNHIGVDVETLRVLPKLYFDSILSEQEFAQVQLDKTTRSINFWTLWTRKEAYLKCLGTGIGLNLQKVEVIDDIVVDNFKQYKLITEVFDKFVISVCVPNLGCAKTHTS